MLISSMLSGTVFVDFKKPNLPFRLVGGFVIGVGIVGLLMIAGVISGVIDELTEQETTSYYKGRIIVKILINLDDYIKE